MARPPGWGSFLPPPTSGSGNSGLAGGESIKLFSVNLGLIGDVFEPGRFLFSGPTPKSVTEQDIAGGINQFYGIALPAESFAQVVAFAISQSQEVDVNELVFRPTCPQTSKRL